MNSSDPDPQEQLYQGHHLESGMLARFREWADVLPWIRLGRTLRVVGSPPLILLTAIAFLVWWLGVTQVLGSRTQLFSFSGSSDSLSVIPRQLVVVATAHLKSMNLTTSALFRSSASWSWVELFVVVWTVVIWAPIAMLLARQGALLTAGRTMVALKPGLLHALRRSPSAWLAVVVPLACVLAIGILILGVGWASKLSGGWVLLEFAFAMLVTLIAIPCGVLAFGAHAAVPLSWAALANEGDPDALDALSRGYEYLFRRPLRLAGYILVALVILIAVAILAWGISAAAAAVTARLLSLVGCPSNVVRMTIQMLELLPSLVILASLWSLIGGIYLLLRYDAGGQEVEDLWEPPPPLTAPLPDIPTA